MIIELGKLADVTKDASHTGGADQTLYRQTG